MIIFASYSVVTTTLKERVLLQHARKTLLSRVSILHLSFILRVQKLHSSKIRREERFHCRQEECRVGTAGQEEHCHPSLTRSQSLKRLELKVAPTYVDNKELLARRPRDGYKTLSENPHPLPGLPPLRSHSPSRPPAGRAYRHPHAHRRRGPR
jgi:hypothetical protein